MMLAMGSENEFRDVTGQRFNKLTALEVASRSPTKWLCQCDCGRQTVVSSASLRRGKTKSCGCHRRTEIANRTRKHGDSHRAPEHRAWCKMLARCRNPNDNVFHHYGGRGIRVCDAWSHSYEAFLRDMGRRPSLAHSLDRVDVNGDYEPSNCRWATKVEQMRNTRDNHVLTHQGVSATLAEWAERTGINSRTLQTRVSRGWPAADALTRPVDVRRRKKLVA